MHHERLGYIIFPITQFYNSHSWKKTDYFRILSIEYKL